MSEIIEKYLPEIKQAALIRRSEEKLLELFKKDFRQFLIQLNFEKQNDHNIKEEFWFSRYSYVCDDGVELEFS